MEMIKIFIIIICINNSLQVCCGYRKFWECYGLGSCNIFCCNCDGGCDIDLQIKRGYIKLTTAEKVCNKKCVRPCPFVSVGWVYSTKTNTCFFSPCVGAFRHSEDCQKHCVKTKH